MMPFYPIQITPDDNATFLVTCPLLPAVATFGDTPEEARRHALDAIETVLDALMRDGSDIPLPLDMAPEPAIRLPLLASLKVRLHVALTAGGSNRDDLGRRLGWTTEMVDALFDLDHPSRLDEVEAAFAALGRRIDVQVLSPAA